MNYPARSRSFRNQKPMGTVAVSELRERQGNRFAILSLMSLLALLAFFAINASALAASPLVDEKWLHENLDKPGIRFVDLQPPNGYMRAHLPGAVNTQYSQWRDKVPDKGKMMPAIEDLEKRIGERGIARDTHVVLTPVGINASEMAVATRIYWTLKALGHEKVSILDGGLIAYSKHPQARFSNKPTSVKAVSYKAEPDESFFPQANDVFAALKKGTAFIDSRSPAEFEGKIADRGERPGTIPGSVNLPFDRLIKQGQGGKFHNLETLKSIYADHGIGLTGKQISFCHTGHRTSLSWFVSYELLGNKDAQMYDGSTAEWARDETYPIEIPQ